MTLFPTTFKSMRAEDRSYAIVTVVPGLVAILMLIMFMTVYTSVTRTPAPTPDLGCSSLHVRLEVQRLLVSALPPATLEAGSIFMLDWSTVNGHRADGRYVCSVTIAGVDRAANQEMVAKVTYDFTLAPLALTIQPIMLTAPILRVK